MIEISIVSNEASYEIELFPPLLELADTEFRKNCIRELSLSFDLAVRDILFGKEPSQYQMYFKKGYLGTAEIFSATIGFDSILTRSENFKSLEETIEKHLKALDAVLEKVDFSPKIQVLSYQAHANVEDDKLNDYIDHIISFRPGLPGEMKNRGIIFLFEGPTDDSTAQIIIGESQDIPSGLFLSIQFSFMGNAANYKQIFKLCEEFSRKHIFPNFEINIKEQPEEE